MFGYVYSLGFTSRLGVGYKPYINYTWSMLPNGQVKNNGTSGTNLQLYSGNPLDFQGSQYISETWNNLGYTGIKTQFSIYCGIYSVGNNTLFSSGYASSTAGLDIAFISSQQIRVSCNNATDGYLYVDYNNSPFWVTFDNGLISVIDDSGVLGTKQLSISSLAFESNQSLNIASYRGMYSYYDGLLDGFVFYKDIPTPTQISQSYSNPNAFYDSMVNDANTLFATDFRGTAGYIADDKNKVVGSTNLNDGTFILESGWIDNLDGSYTHTEGTTRCYQSLEELETDGSLGVGTPILVQFTIDEITSGTFGVNCYGVEVSGTSVGTYTIVGITSNSLNLYLNYPTYKYDGIGTISNIKVFTIGGVYPITNYSETMRTNFQQETTGLQDLTRSFDSLGFYTGVTDYLNCNGVGYGDTGWVPSQEPFTIEFNVVIPDMTTHQDILGSRGNGVVVRKMSNKLCYIYLGDTFITLATDEFGIAKDFVLAFDGTNAYLYKDKILYKTQNNITIANDLSIVFGGSSFYGALAFRSKGTVNKFIVHPKALTNEEIQAL